MAVGYDGKEIGGYMGVFIDLQEKLKAGDQGITKETFVQLLADVDTFGLTFYPLKIKNSLLVFCFPLQIQSAYHRFYCLVQFDAFQKLLK